MLIRMSKKEREYILRSEREGYYEKEIAKIGEELSKESDQDIRKAKQDLINDLEKVAAKTKSHLEKHGPSKWFIRSASKEEIAKEMSRMRSVIGTSKETDKDSITAGLMGTTKYLAIRQFKLGVVRWENLRDADGVEIPYSHKIVDDVVDALPDHVIYEISNEIAGNVTEEDAENLN